MKKVAKRIIFTLLYAKNKFFLSRNFKLQEIGDILWLKKNYNISRLLLSLDELVILNVDRHEKDIFELGECIKEISKSCFIPVTAGGGIHSLDDAKFLFRCGADKILFNTSIMQNTKLIKKISSTYGSQSIIASVDVKKISKDFYVFFENGQKKSSYEIQSYLKKINNLPVGEVLLNSIDKDGTGFGLNLQLVKKINILKKPLIISGGLGKKEHFFEGFKNKKVDAIATSNILNFIGSEFHEIRKFLLKKKINIPEWRNEFLK